MQLQKQRMNTGVASRGIRRSTEQLGDYIVIGFLQSCYRVLQHEYMVPRQIETCAPVCRLITGVKSQTVLSRIRYRSRLQEFAASSTYSSMFNQSVEFDRVVTFAECILSAFYQLRKSSLKHSVAWHFETLELLGLQISSRIFTSVLHKTAFRTKIKMFFLCLIKWAIKHCVMKAHG
jgi:hypothetical protein